MRLGKYLSSLTRCELEQYRNELNLTEDEEKVFDLLSKGKSVIQIADKCLISESTVDSRIRAIKSKLTRTKIAE